MKIGMVSLGCPKNLVDSEVMLGIIKDKQLEITNDPADAELIIVNTCGFIESAKEESISTILQMAQYKEEGSCKYLIMTGCLGQRYADELFESMPEVDAIVGTDSFTDIGWVIDQVLAGPEGQGEGQSKTSGERLRAHGFLVRDTGLVVPGLNLGTGRV